MKFLGMSFSDSRLLRIDGVNYYYLNPKHTPGSSRNPEEYIVEGLPVGWYSEEKREGRAPGDVWHYGTLVTLKAYFPIGYPEVSNA